MASALMAALAAPALVACGDEDPQKINLFLVNDGRGSKLIGPKRVDAGLTEIKFANRTVDDGDLQLIRVDGSHTDEEVAAGLEKAMRGRALPDWFFAAGGASRTGFRGKRRMTQVLEPGAYYAFNTEGKRPLDPKSAMSFEVSGEGSDDELEADGTITAFEYGFEAEGLTEGEVEIAIENAGTQPHHVIAAPLIGDATAADVERFFKTNEGKRPFTEQGLESTAVLEGGEDQLTILALKKGRYVLYCFISDRQGGKPHALKGMVDEVEVE